MPGTLHVFDYLADPDRHAPEPLCVLFGGERFLKRLALQSVQRHLADGGDEEGSPFATFAGVDAEWRDVADELATVTLFGGGPRLAVVQEADEFVRRYRDRLERHIAESKPAGILVLDVQSWPSNTRLYKSIADRGLAIECQPPERPVGKRKVLDEKRFGNWLTHWAKIQHGVRLPKESAQLLLELVGADCGRLDQEMAKLALFTEDDGQASPEMVCEVVGGWITKTIWELVDAAADGNAGEALIQLDRLLRSGENPIGLFGQISWSLRRFAAATRVFQHSERGGRRLPLRNALQEAGFRSWPKGAMESAERQLRQLGRHRAGQLYRWLLEADLQLKGTHSSPTRSRFVLERLLTRMSSELAVRDRSRRTAAR